MSATIIVGLNVVDQQGYQAYRDAMTPLMESYGGRFDYDFTVSEVLKSKTPEHINRLFSLSFESAHAMQDFFADPAYLAVREKHFNSSVDGVTRIAELPAS